MGDFHDMPHASLREQMLLECEAMAKHAATSGSKIPGSLIGLLEDTSQGNAAPDLTQLSTAHAYLSKLVAPATPRSILFMARGVRKKGFWRLLGPVPLTRGLMIAAFLSLIALVALSLSKDVDGTINWQQEEGFKLLLKELFLLSAAGLGASFSALFQANYFIVKGTFDPKYDISYWSRFALGLISGMILAMLVPIDDDGRNFSKPILAMLGGFSVTVVYRVLTRMTAAVESLVHGDEKDIAAARTKKIKAEADEEIGRARIRLAAGLIGLKNELISIKAPEDAIRAIDGMIQKLLSGDAGEEEGEGQTTSG